MGETGNNFHGEWGLYNPLEIETKTFLEFGPLLEDVSLLSLPIIIQFPR